MMTTASPSPELSNKNLLDVLAFHEVLSNFGAGKTIFEAGQEPDGVYVLLSGDVDLKFHGKQDPAPVRLTGGGTILGLSSLTAGRTHEYTATAANDVLLGYVDRKTFMRVLNESPTRWFDVLQILSRDISSCYERVKEISAARAH